MEWAQRTVTINRPIEDVFAFFADGENDPLWRPTVKEIKRDGPLQVGTRYRLRIAGPGGGIIPADFEITQYRPTERVDFKVIAGPVRPTGSYRFTDKGTATDVTFELQAELTGMKKMLMGTAVQKSMDDEMANLDRAKQYLENSDQ
jgi:uncharacterized membrane protein